MKRTNLLIAGIIILSLSLAACAAPAPPAPAEAPPPTEAPAAEPIRIGASLPLTGGFAIPGQLHKDGYEFWAKLVNERGGLLGRPVEL
ncbi:MAG: ABC transporter substrate-binding protein, partial [Anaerolineae bacterium]